VLVEIDNLTKVYGRGKEAVRALDNVSFSIGDGEIVGLLGKNGAGKSTLLKILVGLTRKTGGSAVIDRVGVSAAESRSAVGYVPEGSDFDGFRSARGFIRACGLLHGVKPDVLDGRIRDSLEAFALADAPSSIKAFSKGMRRRLALAQALVHEPRLLLLDEATDGLDPDERRRVLDLLVALKAKGVSTLMSSHVLGEVERVSDRVVILHKGRVATMEVRDGGWPANHLESAFQSATGEA
jgi:ABC-2 type transport system ATP-binding protein